MKLEISIATAVLAFMITWLSGFALVPYLKKLKYGQTILDIGPKWHKNKQGIPTMGGIMFIIGIVIAYGVGIIWLLATGEGNGEPIVKKQLFESLSGLVMAIFFGVMGFLDDFVKVKKKQNQGLTVVQKLIMQAMIIAAYFTTNIMLQNTSTSIAIPFMGSIDLGFLYYPLMGIVIIFLVNAVNLTDGLDGLCSSVTFIYSVIFLFITTALQYYGLSVLSLALGGAMLGFLVWNFYPAKVFMGDTGSLFLGGIVVALGIGSHAEFLMIIASAVYIWEALSVVIQVIYFKLTHGKRLFKMTPIHHSFELRGFSEIRIVFLFSGITLAAGAVAIFLLNKL